MTEFYGPFDAGAGSGFTEAQWRKMAAKWLSDGVYRGYLNGLAVSQRGAGANKSVDVATGGGWVNGHTYETDAIINLVIADNTSGQARIDRIVLRADFTGNTIAPAVVQGTPAATPAPPALTQSSSTWEIPLAQVAAANGFASIGTANITDERQYSAGKQDWQHVPATLTYDSADDPTFVMASTVDLTGIVPVGARFRCVQVAGVVYGIVTAVSSTKLTIYGGTDYNLANAAISSPEFSIAKVPLGFNPSPVKWTETLTDTSSLSQASAAQNTWYNLGSLALAIPIGVWNLSYEAAVAEVTADHFLTLSTANNSETDTDLTAYFAVAGSASFGSTSFRSSKTVELAAKTTYYLNSKTSSAGTPTLKVAGDKSKTIIRAICALL